HQLRNVYIFDDEYETLQDWSVHSNDSSLPASHNFDLQNQNTQWPRIACVYCGKLLYPEKAS
ncbi:12474_t:CDS:2, partial [Gigaspora rosea]